MNRKAPTTYFELATDLSTIAKAFNDAADFARTRHERDGQTPLTRMLLDVPSEVKAASLEHTPASVAWCETHQTEMDVCRRWGRTGCLGVPIVTPSDPTGEFIVAETEGMRGLRVLQNVIEVSVVAVGELQALLKYWEGFTIEGAKAYTDRQDEDANARGENWCECCKRAGKMVPPEGKAARTCDGRLAEPMWLCAWCQKWVRQTGMAPSLMVSEAHCSGHKVRAFQRGDVIEAKTTTGTLVDRFPVQPAPAREDVA